MRGQAARSGGCASQNGGVRFTRGVLFAAWCCSLPYSARCAARHAAWLAAAKMAASARRWRRRRNEKPGRRKKGEGEGMYGVKYGASARQSGVVRGVSARGICCLQHGVGGGIGRAAATPSSLARYAIRRNEAKARATAGRRTEWRAMTCIASP
jgi:hypothetical protein